MSEAGFIRHFNQARPPHNYELIAPIGAGGQAEVFSAYDRRLRSDLPAEERTVAVKVFQPFESDDERRALADEANKIIGLTPHPNIIHVHWQHTHTVLPRKKQLWGEPVKAGNYHYVVMDYVQGGTAQEYAGPQGTMSLDRLASYVSQTALGMMHAHGETRPWSSLKITHRDLKPPNLLVATNEIPEQIAGYPNMSAHGVIKIADFGAATTGHTSIDTITQTQQLIGTWPYVAPEHFEQKAVRASDVYSLGVIAYQWLTGKKPIDAGQYASPVNWYFAHLNNPVPDIETTVAHTRPGGMNQFIEEIQGPLLKMLAKSTKDRYTTMGHFYEDFSDAVRRGAHALDHIPTVIDLAPTPVTDHDATYVPTLHPATYVPTKRDDKADKKTETAATRFAARKPSRRTFMRGAGILVAGLATGDYATSHLTKSEQTARVNTAVIDIAHDILAILKDKKAGDEDMWSVVQHLIPHDPKGMDTEITRMRQLYVGNEPPNGPAWLAGQLANYDVVASTGALHEYLLRNTQDSAAVSRLATMLASRVVTGVGSDVENAKHAVEAAMDSLESDRKIEEQYPITTALNPNNLFKLRPFDRTVNGAGSVMNQLIDAHNFDAIRSLGMALVRNNTSVTTYALTTLRKRLATPDGQTDDTYTAVSSLAYDLLPTNSSDVATEFTAMQPQTSGVADETRKAMAPELAPWSSKLVMRFLQDQNYSSELKCVTAMTLAKTQPEYVKSVYLANDKPEARPWLAMALNPFDTGAVHDTLAMLQENDRVRKAHGANIAAAVLLAYLTRHPI